MVPLTVSVPMLAVFALAVVEVAVPKVPTPATVSVPMLPVFALAVVDVDVVKKPVVAVMAVDDAYGNVEASVVDVAMKYWAVGVVVALTEPLLPAARRELVIPVRLSTPAELNDDVAEPPKYAVSCTESRVEDAWPRVVRPLTVKLVAEVWVGLNVPVTVRVPIVDDCANKFVLLAVVEKRFVVVAFARVVLPATTRLPAESIVVVAVPPKYAVPCTERRVEEA